MRKIVVTFAVYMLFFCWVAGFIRCGYSIGYYVTPECKAGWGSHAGGTWIDGDGRSHYVYGTRGADEDFFKILVGVIFAIVSGVFSLFIWAYLDAIREKFWERLKSKEMKRRA